MAKRPPIPADLERAILIEAGHRCAIHTCRQVPVELAHITPWSKCKEHKFGNLIALCPTCHTRFDRGEIDRRSVLIYKQRLLFQGGHYSVFEQRLLRAYAQDATTEEIGLPIDVALLVAGLLSDGFLVESGQTQAGVGQGDVRKNYKFTAAAREYVELAMLAELSENPRATEPGTQGGD